MERVRYEDYEIEYFDENMFAFLGNGFDTRYVLRAHRSCRR